MPQPDSLGLKENPFNNSTAQRYFYADQNRAQVLEATEHLIDFSNNLQVVMGEPGVGKSHFLEALQARKDNNWRVAKITDAGEHDTLSLIQAILNSFGALPDDDTELLEALEKQLSEIIQLGFKPVLLIDNAQALSADSLRFLLQLSRQQQDDEPYIHIVLFATTIITDTLQAPEFKDFRDIIHIAIINNFDKEGVSGYLRHKLTVAGFNRESPFTPRIVDSIYKDSAGIPDQINFFASKFLASSGKGENYIETEPAIDPIKNENINAFNAMDIDNVKNNDQIDEQLNRLTEKFDEIEKMGEQADDYSYPDEDFIDKEQIQDDSANESFMDQPSYKTNNSKLSKFILPAALGAFVLFALFVMNSVFNQSDDAADQQAQNENIELLPLELPAEGSFAANKSDLAGQEKSLQQEKSPQPEGSHQKELTEQSSPAAENSKGDHVEAPQNDSDAAAQPERVAELEIIEAGSSETKLQAIDKEDNAKSSTSIIPEITAIEPEPVIGSNKPQYVTIRGHNFSSDMSLIVSFGTQKKEFSKTLTPQQWIYENEGKIKLYVTTGIDDQHWQMTAKNKNARQSNSIHFDVVKPFIPQLEISSILPNPLAGSDKQQKLTIMGKGFSRQTEIKLEWDNNKKHFSARLTPNQFEYAGSNKINLFITTGKKDRLWKVSVINSGSGQQDSSSFKVISGTAAKEPALKAKEKTGQAKKAATISRAENSKTAKTSRQYKVWIWSQNSSDYTIQLLALSKEQAVKAFIDAQKIKQKSAYFKIQRNGKPLYVLIYGVYADKKSAEQAKDKLQSRIKGSKPWVRSFSDIHGLIKQ